MAASMENRDFPNTLNDYNGEELLKSDGSLVDVYEKNLKSSINRLLGELEDGIIDLADYSVYTGSTGITQLYLHLYKVLYNENEEHILHKALKYVQTPLKYLKGRRISFLCGDAGPLAISALLYKKLGQEDKSQDCITRLLALHKDVVKDGAVPDEMLYGRAGYLYALLFVNQHLGDIIDKDIIKQVFNAIITSGQELSGSMKSPCPLMYMWHDKVYLGAAHGLTGIFFTLMQLYNSSEKYKHSLDQLVKPSIDYLMTLKFPSGNYPSSLSSKDDRLVHWCHGAPGWIHMFIMAYKTFGEEKYLSAAIECADVIWERGLLKKGYGLCHGVAGNAYGLLALFNHTQENKYLHRALKFAEWCMDYGKHGCRVADRPYSLYEGLAGTIYFLSDLLKPGEAQFPAFYL